MRIVYLESAREDLLWMRHYYEVVFSEGLSNARSQFHAIEQLLLANPFMGHKTHRKDVYEFPIPKTPFSYIYSVSTVHIAILRVWDERRGRGDLND